MEPDCESNPARNQARAINPVKSPNASATNGLPQRSENLAERLRANAVLLDMMASGETRLERQVVSQIAAGLRREALLLQRREMVA